MRTEVGIPVASSWNLGKPQNADAVIQSEQIDIVMLGRPALTNPHGLVWAARELGYDNPIGLVPDDWGHWLRNFRGDQESVGLPAVEEASAGAPVANAAPTSGFRVVDEVVEGSVTLDGVPAHDEEEQERRTA